MTYFFEDLTLDGGRRELRRGAELVPVEPQVFDILEYLIRHRDRVVSKDDLIAGVWHGRIVSESTLTSRITAARQAIGDSGETQRLIRTVARKGLRFVGRVSEKEQREEEQPFGAAQAAPAAKAPVLALPDKPSIVVLPFANLSGDASQDYFVDGMVEDITVALGRLPWLFVIGSSSALTYKNRAVDTRQVGTELGVRYALRGSVRKENNRVRITAQLADTSHGGQVWADGFEGEFDGIFELQDRIAAQVRTAISPVLRAEELDRARQKPTENLTAYDLYLRALPIHRGSFVQNQEALPLLYRAIELDPGYGAAYGLAAWCYDLQKMFGWIPPTDPRIEEGIRVARLAAKTGQNDPEALWMAAHALVLLAGDPELARPLVGRAISLNPNSPNAWWVSGSVHNHLGEYDVALEHLSHARRLSPLEPLAFTHWMATSIGYFLAGRYEEAVAAADRSLSERPDFSSPLRVKIAACGLLGRIEEGREAVELLLRLNPEATVGTLRAYWEPHVGRRPRDLENLLSGLRLSGLPEGGPT